MLYLADDDNALNNSSLRPNNVAISSANERGAYTLHRVFQVKKLFDDLSWPLIDSLSWR